MDKTALYSKAFLESMAEAPEIELSRALSRLQDVLKSKDEHHLYPRILKKIIATLEYKETAVVTSARPLTSEMKQSIENKIKKEFPEVNEENIQYREDKKVIGGVSILYRDQMFDGTIERTLRKLIGGSK